MLTNGPSRFHVDASTLDKLTNRREEDLVALGGVDGLLEKLCTSREGLSQLDIDSGCADRHEAFGCNEYPHPASKSFVRLWLECLEDPILLILILSAVVSFGLSFIPKDSSDEDGKWDWIEGAAILAAIVIVCTVTAFNDWSKERQFRALEAAKDRRQVKVVRAGSKHAIDTADVVVGDILVVSAGDVLPADALILQCYNLETNEAALTGEACGVGKGTHDPILRSGSTIVSGSGTAVVIAVGTNTEWGRLMTSLSGESGLTPLQEKLDDMAKLVGYIGMGSATLTLVILGIRWLIRIFSQGTIHWSDWSDWIDFIILAVTIVVVAVPEGLPLAVTISLAYSMKRMMKDNLLVRHLSACETMGGATNICSDKTGTLTTGRMTVATVLHPETLSAAARRNILVAATANTSCFKDTATRFLVGSGTETAIATWALHENRLAVSDLDYVKSQIKIHVPPYFNSNRKFTHAVSTPVPCEILDGDTATRLTVIGAPEHILQSCTRILDSDGSVIELRDDHRSRLKHTIDQANLQGMRTIALAYRESTPSEIQPTPSDLILTAIVSLEDPLRPEIRESVARCHAAGITVRMVTGDHISTACSIAKSAGIMTDEDIAVEGSDLRGMSRDEFQRIVGRLRVVARSSPTDKHWLVQELQAMGEVVAVTGDGANDAPALKEADVGLAMGISGTEVAKEASDIILLDDNFHSVEMAILWGRAVYDNIRKFLQFQLTVNVVALVIAACGALFLGESPLNAVQLLWVNLIMDTLAALALATEGPHEGLLEEKPHGRGSGLISNRMWRDILGHALLQLVVLSTLSAVIPEPEPPLVSGIAESVSAVDQYYKSTIIFNAFVFLQWFNQINCRRVNTNRCNILEGVGASTMFMAVQVIIVITQVLLVQVFYLPVRVAPLGLRDWAVCIAIGSVSIPYGFILRRLPEPADLSISGLGVYMSRVLYEVVTLTLTRRNKGKISPNKII
ncbi:Cation-transporting P-type ATPase [Carpediemonas membranifera]|uniref:Calcium-transporting ATPase n=1 Tax=Carpediemonas membranifera TaxID=201153 RepID=A0A8J6BAR4_9EUKA|nr:Cation-transporting P-type ATPase [Carpediemonas membranifera]|eukprot:KAG9396332.1 Cation-transporting P-type ATPase [Carpediemonas membranifera]